MGKGKRGRRREEEKKSKGREKKKIFQRCFYWLFFFSLSSSTSDLQPGRLVGGTARLTNRVTINSVCGTLGAHNGVTEGV